MKAQLIWLDGKCLVAIIHLLRCDLLIFTEEGRPAYLSPKDLGGDGWFRTRRYWLWGYPTQDAGNSSASEQLQGQK